MIYNMDKRDRTLRLLMTRIEELERRVDELENRPVVEIDKRPATAKLLEYLKENQRKNNEKSDTNN